MLLECHSPQPKCIPVPLCPPILDCCKCPSECICITNCFSQEPNPNKINFQTDICQNKNELTYELTSKEPLSPVLNCPKNQKIFTGQIRNSTPDVTRLHSKTNALFNLNRKNANDNYMNNYNNKHPIYENELEDIEEYDDDKDKKYLDSKPNLTVTRNNSFNFTFRKRTNNNNDQIQNKANLSKKKRITREN